MTAILTDEKRAALAEKLADIKAGQELIIANEEQFISEIEDKEISDRIRKMLEDDKKNLGVLETVIIQYGIQSQGSDTAKELLQQAKKMQSSSALSIYQKVFQHELLKHEQVVSGLVVHKAAQIIGADVEAAITPLNTVNFENRAHQEQLKGILEVLGTRELTGQDADQGVWARVQDAVAAFSGVVGSVVTQNSDKSDMNVQDVIRMDHQKVNILIMEMEKCEDPTKLQEYFGQLYADLSAHSEAEEQIVYPHVRPFYGNEPTDELYHEQAELKGLLEQMKSAGPSSSEFKSLLKQVKDAVMDHTRQEESTMFAAIRNNCSTEQQELLATQFKEAKKQLQEKMS
ncbi:MAG: DNA nickase [Chroococcopsis gigantea SAG 12.99]|jgi:hemerythrin superfamily protein|nr:hemerythrin domain-containing protein [Chlorogloea purpurea SAG 13.99]MDV3001916.1 DNA nickase [Chroococcopsis gigantea SAG 12.99]